MLSQPVMTVDPCHDRGCRTGTPDRESITSPPGVAGVMVQPLLRRQTKVELRGIVLAPARLYVATELSGVLRRIAAGIQPDVRRQYIGEADRCQDRELARADNDWKLPAP